MSHIKCVCDSPLTHSDALVCGVLHENMSLYCVSHILKCHPSVLFYFLVFVGGKVAALDVFFVM